MRQDHPRRASGTTSSNAAAATADRKLATCHPVKLAALMAAPPVENRTAAATSSKRLRNGEDSMGQRAASTCLRGGRPRSTARGCERIGWNAGLAGESACPTLPPKDLRASGAGAFACRKGSSQTLKER